MPHDTLGKVLYANRIAKNSGSIASVFFFAHRVVTIAESR